VTTTQSSGLNLRDVKRQSLAADLTVLCDASQMVGEILNYSGFLWDEIESHYYRKF
jgi:hypothetical protein